MNNENQPTQPNTTPPDPNNQINPQQINPTPQPAPAPMQNTTPETPQSNQGPIQQQPVVTPAQSTPETPTHTLGNSNPDQTTTTMPSPEKHHMGSHNNNEYNSNPFIVTGKGLGLALSENPVPSIMIAFLPFLIVFPVIAIFFPLSIVVSLSGGAIGALLAGLIGLVLLIAFVLLLIRIAAGSINILLKSADGEKITTKQALGSLSSGRLTSFAWAWFLSSLAIFFGFLLFIIPGIYLLARLSLAPAIIYAEDQKAMAALKRSFAMTKGHVFEMLGAITAQSLLSGNGVLSVIGASSGVVKRYKELSAAEKAGITDTGKVHWLNYLIPVLGAIFTIVYIAASVFTSSPTNNFNNDLNTNNGSFFSSAIDTQSDTIIKNDINSLYQQLEVYYNENGGYPNEAITSSNVTSIFSGIDSGAVVDENGNEIEITFEDDFFYSTFPEPTKSNQYALVLYGEGCDGLGSAELCSGYVLSGYQSNGINYVKYSLN